MKNTTLNPRVQNIVDAYTAGRMTSGAARKMLGDIAGRVKPLEEDIQKARVAINLHETLKMMHEDRQQPGGQKKMASMIEMHGELSP